jgi:hypothetical protein
MIDEIYAAPAVAEVGDFTELTGMTADGQFSDPNPSLGQWMGWGF